MVILICVLSMPTSAVLLGIMENYSWTADSLPALMPWLEVGAVLGIANILARPVLRVLSAPIGCLTLGLFGFVIDVALIYASAYFVPGFTVPSLLYAAVTAAFINTICAVVGAR